MLVPTGVALSVPVSDNDVSDQNPSAAEQSTAQTVFP